MTRFPSMSSPGNAQSSGGSSSQNNGSSNNNSNTAVNNNGDTYGRRKGGNRTRFKHTMKESGIPEDCVFETREERGLLDKQSQFVATYNELMEFVRLQVKGKEGKKLLLEMLKTNSRNYDRLKPEKPPSDADSEQQDEYQSTRKKWLEQKHGLEDGKERLLGVIKKLCSPAMIAQLETKEDYADLVDDADVIGILQRIREISTAFEKHLHQPESLATHVHAFYTTYQGSKEPLHEFVKNFHAQKDTIDDFGGTIGIHSCLVAKHLGISTSEYQRKEGTLWTKAALC